MRRSREGCHDRNAEPTDHHHCGDRLSINGRIRPQLTHQYLVHAKFLTIVTIELNR